MNNERYNQIIDEAYEKYITQIRIEFEKWCARNPYTLVNYREDTKELFLKSIKEDTHWFTGEKNFSEKWGLKIEERELSLEERGQWCEDFLDWDLVVPNLDHDHIREDVEENAPTKLITVTYKDEKTEIYE